MPRTRGILTPCSPCARAPCTAPPAARASLQPNSRGLVTAPMQPSAVSPRQLRRGSTRLNLRATYPKHIHMAAFPPLNSRLQLNPSLRPDSSLQPNSFLKLSSLLQLNSDDGRPRFEAVRHLPSHRMPRTPATIHITTTTPTTMAFVAVTTNRDESPLPARDGRLAFCRRGAWRRRRGSGCGKPLR